jgi:hypothetical protein
MIIRLSPSTILGALSLSKGIPRALDRGVEWVDLTLLKKIKICNKQVYYSIIIASTGQDFAAS